jgi:hypothetical protein
MTRPTKPSRRPAKAPQASQPVVAPAPDLPPVSPVRKPELIRARLAAPGGASMDQLIAVTGWQAHSIRAAMTGLRKQGHAIHRETVDGCTRYLIPSSPEAAQ